MRRHQHTARQKFILMRPTRMGQNTVHRIQHPPPSHTFPPNA
jgi:hypothetical protein